MEAGHRKIELGSAPELQRLIAHLTRLGRAQLDQDNGDPPRQQQQQQEARLDEVGTPSPAPMKGHAPTHIQYLHRTIAYALPNLTINGIDAALPPPAATSGSSSSRRMIDRAEYAPYDPELATRVQALYAALEAETVALAHLRRDAPARAAEQVRRAFDRDQAVREEEGEEEEVEVERLTVLVPPRSEEVRRAWGVGVHGLVRLTASLPATAAKLERARAAVDYVQEGR
ncbi:MAG: hypothetical protein M1826_003862 [Phylliscum demangeonii]|nr:MAG: hypothetical protein M1826_003862 [Phylliscum demangeonii]